jgi:hypothetical protein
MANRKWFTPPEVGKIYGVSVHKILFFIKTGELRAVNLASDLRNRPRWVIDPADLVTFEKKREAIPGDGLSTTQRLRRRAASGVTEFV